jgi:hypothetical protein
MKITYQIKDTNHILYYIIKTRAQNQDGHGKRCREGCVGEEGDDDDARREDDDGVSEAVVDEVSVEVWVLGRR